MKLAVMLPGQGSQVLGMLKNQLAKHPEIIQPILDTVKDVLGKPIADLLVQDPSLASSLDINATSLAQPTILAASYANYQLYLRAGGRPASISLGHSLGEFTAVTIAGIVSFEDALQLVHKRGLAMESATCAYKRDSGMFAIRLSPKDTAEAEKIIASNPNSFVTLANINSSNQVVLSGDAENVGIVVRKIADALTTRLKAVRLNVSGPFHSAIMEPARKEMEEIISKMSLSWPPSENISVVANYKGDLFESLQDVKKGLVNSCTSPVLWLKSVEYVNNHADAVVAMQPGDIFKLASKDTTVEFLKSTLA